MRHRVDVGLFLAKTAVEIIDVKTFPKIKKKTLTRKNVREIKMFKNIE